MFSSWDRFDGEAGSRYEDDTLALGLGAAYRLDTHWTLRAGYLFDEGKSYAAAMVPTGPLGDQHVVSLGAGYTPDGARGVDLAVAHSRGEELASEIAGLNGDFEDFQRWTAAVTGWWRF
jgi:long-subunit fatty acid transport protein